MTVTVSSFRAFYPVFTDPSIYPDSMISQYITVACMFINPGKWRQATDFGVQLFVAHHLVIAAQAAQQAELGGIPGTKIGILNSKSVDKVSAGYDVGAVANEGASFWNQTMYGIEFWRYVQMFGAGGLVNGGGPLPTGPGIGWGTAGGWPFG